MSLGTIIVSQHVHLTCKSYLYIQQHQTSERLYSRLRAEQAAQDREEGDIRNLWLKIERIGACLEANCVESASPHKNSPSHAIAIRVDTQANKFKRFREGGIQKLTTASK